MRLRTGLSPLIARGDKPHDRCSTLSLQIIEVPVDEMVILTTQARKRATKVHTKSGVLPYDAGAKFTWRPESLTSVQDIYAVLKQLGPQELVIRGEIRKAGKVGVNRLLHYDAKYDRHPDWKAANPGRRWVMFDFDDLPINWSPATIPAVVEAARRKLPACFHSASCAYRMSASSGLKSWDKAGVHLWFWMDRPVADASLREWAVEARVCDASLFNPVQPHYVVDPIFEDDIIDPLQGARLGFLQGTQNAVTPPADWIDYPAWERLVERRILEREASLPPLTPEDIAHPEATQKYVLGALNRAVAEIRDQTKGYRHPTAVNCAFAIGGYIGAGYIDRRTAELSLVAAIQAVVPRDRYDSEADTIKEMLEIGIAKPRVLRKLWKIPWIVVDDDGKPLTCVENTEVMLAHYRVQVRYNLMTHSEEVTLKHYSGAAERKQNAADAQIREWAHKHGLNAEKRLDNHVNIIMANNHYHPVAEWIRSKEWDGISRVDQLFDSITLRDSTQRALMLRVFTVWAATAARLALVDAAELQGVASQFVFVLQGPGGKNKTRWIMSLVPPRSEWAREGVTLDPQNKDSVQQATCAWLIELGELDATFKKDFIALKAFVTNRTDTYRVAFDRKHETLARRTIYAGSVNEQCFLKDDTGNRKFAVVGVTRCDPNHGVDLQQFWAEMAAHPPTYLTSDEERQLDESNQKYEVSNPMADMVAFYWENVETKVTAEEAAKEKWFSLKEILAGVDMTRSWATPDHVAASRALRNKMKAQSRIVDGYRVFRVKKREQKQEPVEDLFGGKHDKKSQ